MNIPKLSAREKATILGDSLTRACVAAVPSRVKYIIVDVEGFKLAILFHEVICHSQAINCREVKPISAGFALIYPDRVVVEADRSVSLGIGPQPGDARVIDDTLALMGLRPLTRSAIERKYMRFPTES